MPIQSSEIKLKVNDTEVNSYLAVPASGNGRGVLVLHAWWGLNPFFKQICDKLAEQGFVAFAPDLRNGKVALTVDQAKELMEQEDQQFIQDTVIAGKDYLLAFTKDNISVMGFSMGAAWSLVTSMMDPENISAVVLFYGAYSVDFSKVKAKFIGHFAEVDEWESLESVQAMQKEMVDAGLDATLHIYSNVSHWFMEDDRPEFDEAVAKIVWDRTIEFLNTSIK